MSILNVNQIQPVGSGQTVTINAANITASSSTISASSFVGPLTGNATGLSGSPTLSGITSVSTTNLTVNGNAYPSAGPLSNRNIIINGSMVVNQRGITGAAGTTTNGAYVTDRFKIEFSHDGAVSVGQTSINSTTGGNAYADGFQNALFFNVTTADTSLGESQYQLIRQPIEGYNVQGIKKGTANAQPVTLSFWVRSSTTGTYIVELQDFDNTRTCSQSYTISSANTWEKKVLTYPADTTGVFDNDNNTSFRVTWWLAAGSTYSSGTLQTTWGTLTNANRAPGQVNLLETVGNNFWFTGVQLEVGTVATPFEHRSYGQELALCYRYYQLMTNFSNSFNAPGTSESGFFNYEFKVPMRQAPTVTITSTGTTSRLSSLNVSTTGIDTVSLQAVSSSSGMVYVYGSTAANASAEL